MRPILRHSSPAGLRRASRCLPPLPSPSPAAARQPPDQVKQLIAVLKSDASQKEKADACRELARIGTKDAVPRWPRCCRTRSSPTWPATAWRRSPTPSVDKALRDAAAKLQGRPLVGVIGSIGVRRDAKAVKLLAKLLHDPDHEVAQAAARSLGSIGS